MLVGHCIYIYIVDYYRLYNIQDRFEVSPTLFWHEDARKNPGVRGVWFDKALETATIEASYWNQKLNKKVWTVSTMLIDLVVGACAKELQDKNLGSKRDELVLQRKIEDTSMSSTYPERVLPRHWYDKLRNIEETYVFCMGYFFKNIFFGIHPEV